MKRLIIFILLFNPFLIYAQEKSFSNINDLKNKILNLEQQGDTSTESYCVSLSDLGLLYENNEMFYESGELFLKSSNATKRIFGENHSKNLFALEHLAISYKNQGKYYKAEQIYLSLLNLNKQINGENTIEFSNSIDGLAQIYRLQNRNSESENLFLRALEIRKSILGEKDSSYVSSINNLASIYQSQKRYSDAEFMYLKAIKIKEELIAGNPFNYSYAIYLNNLASLYDDQRRFTEAQKLYLKVLEIKNKLFGQISLSYSVTLKNLALSYREQMNFKEAEPLFLQSLKIKEKILDKTNPNYITNLLNLAVLYRLMDSTNKSSFYFELFSKANQKRMTEDIFGLSDKELLNYKAQKSDILNSPLSFLYDMHTQFPANNITCFENEVLFKNLSLKNQLLLKNTIKNSGNDILIQKYKLYCSLIRNIIKYRELPLLKRPNNFDSLVQVSEQIEKELIKESAVFSNYIKEMTRSFESIKNNLKKGELLIDFISFNYYKTNATGKVLYGAFIVKKELNEPKFIPLFDEQKLVTQINKNNEEKDSSLINRVYSKNYFYDFFIKPLENELVGFDKIYLCPIGIGQKINFSAIPISKDTMFGEKYDLHIVNSPTQVVDFKSLVLKDNPEILLYGGIDYNNSSTIKINSVKLMDTSLTKDVDEPKLRNNYNAFSYLKGTKKEVEVIHEKAVSAGFKTSLLNRDNATEESIKKLDGRTTPFVLHIATHGFFFPKPDKQNNSNFYEQNKFNAYKISDDPMIRSGLIFSGANNNWDKIKDTTIEDGILSATEISNLDLSACDFVVLSACETGLGEIKGSEGVFGLQRAFKMAGVKYLIVSLWKVPDAQTTEFMQLFYSSWLIQKLPIREAFRQTQLTMSKKYLPYQWAGFVLVE